MKKMVSMMCAASLIASIFVFPINTFANENVNNNYMITNINANSTASYVLYTNDGRELIFPAKEEYDLYLQSHQLSREYGEDWRLQSTLAKEYLSHHFAGYHSGTPNWIKASEYTLTTGKTFTVGSTYLWENVNLNLGFSYSFSVATTIPADANRYSRLGVYADYTLKKEEYAEYQYGQPTGATRISTYAERTATYIDPVYQ